MVVTAPPKKVSTGFPFGEQRVVFHHLTWDGYLAMLAAVGKNRAARLTYDQGTLEITMPLEIHEFSGRMIALFIRILVEELGLKLKTMGSTTLQYPELDKGAEPDECFYIQNYPLVAGRKVDLAKDPPPDLVVEVDITHTDIDKPALYATMGVKELWRYDGELLRIYLLQDSMYQEKESSETFPQIKKEQLYRFLSESEQDEAEASINFRKWVREIA